MIGASRAGVFSGGDAIPDTLVSRPPDDGSTTPTTKLGLRFTTAVDWPKNSFDAKISQNVLSQSTAYLYRVSDSTLIDTVDVSSLVAGDSFTFAASLSAGTAYDVVLDNNGSSWTTGFDTGTNFPIASPDGNLTIESGIDRTNVTLIPDSHAILQIGNIITS